jgi:hypothetical protein
MQAYATNFRSKSATTNCSPSLRKASNKLLRLIDSDKAVWDKQDYPAKSIILGHVTPTSNINPSQILYPRASPSRQVISYLEPTKPSLVLQNHNQEISAYDFLHAKMHPLETIINGPKTYTDDVIDQPTNYEDSERRLINVARFKWNPIPLGDIRRVMS